jgi:hypothetical protein
MKVGQNRYYLICYVRVRARIWSAIRGKKKRGEELLRKTWKVLGKKPRN